MLLKIKRDLSGYLNSRIKRRPFFAVFRITRRCDLRCRMCRVWKTGSAREEMSLEQVARVAEILKRLRIPYVIITGGEPFLHPHLFEILDIFYRSGFAIRLETNAGKLVTPNKLDQAVQSGATDFSVSLDAVTPAIQSFICNSEGIWETITGNLEYAIKIFPGDLPLVNTVVTRLNFRELPQLVKYVHQKNAYIMIVPVVLSSNTQDNKLFRGACEEFEFTEADYPELTEVYRELINMRKSGFNILNSTRFLKDSLKAIISKRAKWECDAGEFYIEILPDGQLGICNDIPGQLNVLDKDFFETFHSRAFRRKVKELRKSCSGCTYGIYREVSYHMNDYVVLGERMSDLTKEIAKRMIGGGIRPNKARRRNH